MALHTKRELLTTARCVFSNHYYDPCAGDFPPGSLGLWEWNCKCELRSNTYWFCCFTSNTIGKWKDDSSIVIGLCKGMFWSALCGNITTPKSIFQRGSWHGKLMNGRGSWSSRYQLMFIFTSRSEVSSPAQAYRTNTVHLCYEHSMCHSFVLLVTIVNGCLEDTWLHPQCLTTMQMWVLNPHAGTLLHQFCLVQKPHEFCHTRHSYYSNRAGIPQKQSIFFPNK